MRFTIRTEILQIIGSARGSKHHAVRTNRHIFLEYIYIPVIYIPVLTVVLHASLFLLFFSFSFAISLSLCACLNKYTLYMYIFMLLRTRGLFTPPCTTVWARTNTPRERSRLNSPRYLRRCKKLIRTTNTRRLE